jgi:hypothetical protein
MGKMSNEESYIKQYGRIHLIIWAENISYIKLNVIQQSILSFSQDDCSIGIEFRY